MTEWAPAGFSLEEWAIGQQWAFGQQWAMGTAHWAVGRPGRVVGWRERKGRLQGSDFGRSPKYTKTQNLGAPGSPGPNRCFLRGPICPEPIVLNLPFIISSPKPCRLVPSPPFSPLQLPFFLHPLLSHSPPPLLPSPDFLPTTLPTQPNFSPVLPSHSHSSPSEYVNRGCALTGGWDHGRRSDISPAPLLSPIKPPSGFKPPFFLHSPP